MKIELVPSKVGKQAAKQFCIGALFDDSAPVDAGTIGILWHFDLQSDSSVELPNLMVTLFARNSF